MRSNGCVIENAVSRQKCPPRFIKPCLAWKQQRRPRHQLRCHACHNNQLLGQLSNLRPTAFSLFLLREEHPGQCLAKRPCPALVVASRRIPRRPCASIAPNRQPSSVRRRLMIFIVAAYRFAGACPAVPCSVFSVPECSRRKGEAGRGGGEGSCQQGQQWQSCWALLRPLASLGEMLEHSLRRDERRHSRSPAKDERLLSRCGDCLCWASAQARRGVAGGPKHDIQFL